MNGKPEFFKHELCEQCGEEYIRQVNSKLRLCQQCQKQLKLQQNL
jgi:ribosomal protein L37AE/L43A